MGNMMSWMVFGTDNAIFNQEMWLGKWTCADNKAFFKALVDAGILSLFQSRFASNVTIKFTFEACGEDGFDITNHMGVKREGVVHGATMITPKGKLFGEGTAAITFEGNVITIVKTTDEYVVTMKRFDNDGSTHKMSFNFQGTVNGKSSECVLTMNKTEEEAEN